MTAHDDTQACRDCEHYREPERRHFTFHTFGPCLAVGKPDTCPLRFEYDRYHSDRCNGPEGQCEHIRTCQYTDPEDCPPPKTMATRMDEMSRSK